MLTNEESLKLLKQKHEAQTAKRKYKLHLYLSGFRAPTRVKAFKTLDAAKSAAERECYDMRDEAIIFCSKKKTHLFRDRAWIA